jgi:hypothetical protein
MLYREIMAVCSEIHTERIPNTLCGKNVVFPVLHPTVHKLNGVNDPSLPMSV